MYNEPRELIASYRSMPVILAALVQDLDDAVATLQADTDWSVGEVICHLLDGEQRTYERIIRIRDEDRPSLALYPDDDARLLEKLEPDAWGRTGLHEIEGELSILDITRQSRPRCRAPGADRPGDPPLPGPIGRRAARPAFLRPPSH